MTLAHLSLQQCSPGTSPRAPTNDERVRAFRDLLPVYHGNNHFNFSPSRATRNPSKGGAAPNPRQSA